MIRASLTVGIKAMRDAAIQLTKDDIVKQPYVPDTTQKMHLNPLKHTFQSLIDVLWQQSREAEERDKAKRRMTARAAKKARGAKKANVTTEVKDPTTAKVPSIIQSKLYGTQPGLSKTREPSTPPNTVTPTKRTVSGTSFGKDSTEGTPSKLTSPEPNIQNLQNFLVYDVLGALYDVASIPVTWAQNREMRINYSTFVHLYICN